MPSENSPETLSAAHAWIIGPGRGMSSEFIWAHMMGVMTEVRFVSHPHDPSDINRCFQLLHKVPAWRERIGEMTVYGPVWEALVQNWSRLETMFEAEVGVNWSNGREAPRTYAAMKKIIDQTRGG